MPTNTNMLDYGNFVYSPEVPENSKFVEYLGYVDRLLQRQREMELAWKESPFSPEVESRKREVAEVLREYVASFRDKYAIRSVEQDTAFLPVSQFLSRFQRIREPFSILHCNLDMPLHTVHAFRGHVDLAAVNAALDEDTPLLWWQRGPHNNPCYLFGDRVWELKPSELDASKEGIAMVFIDASEKDRQKLNRLSRCNSSTATLSDADAIPGALRISVWRRSGGKCAKCGSHKQLDFDHIVPINKGGTNTADNIQLLCGKCRESRRGKAEGGRGTLTTHHYPLTTHH